MSSQTETLAGPGLSPPTRGNHSQPLHSQARSRSIPAHAGEPDPPRSRLALTAVYPRPRGGTRADFWQMPESAGLSPPTRGNRLVLGVQMASQRSIPAHAGEPLSGVELANRGSVYPRPRGGTEQYAADYPLYAGLSPPTRGNPAGTADTSVIGRSIPAHAGEPRRGGRRGGGDGVYPRPRGGTAARDSGGLGCEGLSPPTRGNPAPAPDGARVARSIPAHAGEPAKWQADDAFVKVYPRPRGGTATPAIPLPKPPGLSPPTRGNR